MRRQRMLFALLTVITLISVMSAQEASVTVPNLIRYGGVLRDAQGGVVSSRVVGITFLIYKQQDGGAPVWLETQNVMADASGNYEALLGSTKAAGLPSDLFSQNEQRWLAVKVEGQPEQARVLLVSVPYAFTAHEAETLGGYPASAFVKTTSAASTVSTAETRTAVDALSQIGQSIGVATLGQTSPAVLTNAYIPIWNGSEFTNSVMFQVGQGANGTTVNANGNFNLLDSFSYQIGGNPVLRAGNKVNLNLFVGPGTGTSKYNTGQQNTFVGFAAGGMNTTGSGNTFGGSSAGFYNTTGQSNTFYGAKAGGNNTEGNHNTFVGKEAGTSNTTGVSNVFIGDGAGYSNLVQSNDVFVGASAGYYSRAGANTFIGAHAGSNFKSGGMNVAIGLDAGAVNETGWWNIYLGTQAGLLQTSGSNNIYIGTNVGPMSPESDVIRLGKYAEATYIAGIYGQQVSSDGLQVMVDSSGHLGTVKGDSPANLQMQVQQLQQKVSDLEQRLSQLEKLVSAPAQ